MHDYFDILGLPTNAAASEIRRASARRLRRTHPDFRERSGLVRPTPVSIEVTGPEVAIDFIDMTALVERMQAAFFVQP